MMRNRYKTRQNMFLLVFVISIFICMFTGCEKEHSYQQMISTSVSISQAYMDVLHDELSAIISAKKNVEMQKEGLIGAMGGVHVKLTKSGTQKIMLPIPQLTNQQIPLCFYITSNSNALEIEYFLQNRDEENYVVIVNLNGKRNQEVILEWSAVVLIVDGIITANNTEVELYSSPTKCCQADSEKIKQLADKLWTENGDVDDYARNIQRYILNLKQIKQPKSLDALEALASQTNYICTANANLAVALMRAKQIEARSLAVIPPISQRLEMHRIVQYKKKNLWYHFDPSSLHTDIPMKPWQKVVMAKSSLEDENTAMKPRMGVMLGSPYAQEVELLTSGVSLWGQDFFWTMAKPLAQFKLDDEMIEKIRQEWLRYLENGILSEEQVRLFNMD